MPALSSAERKLLDEACVQGRRASEQAVRAALKSLAVTADRSPSHLSEAERQVRRGLRAKARQLGDTGADFDLLAAECAYEQWHRLLFARFLAENNLLIHPEYRAPVTLDDCEELAAPLGEPDGWAVAGRFAAEILPGIFRLDDPCVQLRLAAEGRLELETIVASLPVAVFHSDDALGWVYQYWQREPKEKVNRSERKVGGADIGPVTQLFTENYMVRFLLQNSLGAWWAARHPDSPLISQWEYLRFDAGRAPAAGSFERWPMAVADVTVMDPCCGSGHFLVEAFEMLWQMRAEEEGLDIGDAQDAVLRDNLFGLELDPRCVQIAMFALALHAWKASAGWRALPVPKVACSGSPVLAAADEWSQLADGDQRIQNALTRLHILFREADSLGSLLSPRVASEVSDPTGLQRSLDDVDWAEVQPLLTAALSREPEGGAGRVFGAVAADAARSAEFLSATYTLVVTNPPYLGRIKQATILRDYLESHFAEGRQDLATAFLQRIATLTALGGTSCVVLPQNWMIQPSYSQLRSWYLGVHTMHIGAILGEEAFESFGIRGPRVVLLVQSKETPKSNARLVTLDASSPPGKHQVLIPEKRRVLAQGSLGYLEQSQFAAIPGRRILFNEQSGEKTLRSYANSFQGLKSGDDGRFRQMFWETPGLQPGWRLAQGSPEGDGLGFQFVVRWGADGRDIARAQGMQAWGRQGVVVTRTRSIATAPYEGHPFFSEVAAIVPHSEDLLPAVSAFAASGLLAESVREIDSATILSNGTFLDVPFDADHWRAVAQSAGLSLPAASRDAADWIFSGRPEHGATPLQVGVSRLLGYRWPEQEADDLDAFADDDGIACLVSVRGERTAAERLQELLARAFGGTWSPSRTRELLAASGSKKTDLDEWLRDDFFKAHCQVFKNRPLIWHVWDGRRDGFSALLNYHRLDRPMMEKLAYSYLGDWIERQVAGVRDDVPGAEERLAAARALREKFEAILEGDPPYDIYVRWKSLAEQPIGWDPDLNDGVRVNVRPFVEAGVLRAKFNVKWDKDRGKNPDGSERLNDLHYTLAQKQTARGGRA